MPHQPRPRYEPGRGVWRCQYRGRIIQRKSEAECAAELARRQAADAALRAPKRARSVGDAIELYVQSRSSPPYTYAVDAFETWIGAEPLSAVEPDTLERYVAWLVEQGLAPATVQKYGRFARSVLDYAWRRGWLRTPVLPVKMPKAMRNPRGLGAEAVARILAALPPYAEPIVRFIIESGARPSEACGLRWVQVDLERRTAILEDHKTAHSTGRPRVIYLTPIAQQIIESQRREGPFVFPSSRGGRYTIAGLRAVLRRAGKDALGKEAPAVTTMQLRHTFAQHAMRRLPVQAVAKLLGHTSITTTQHYASVDDAHALEAAAGLVVAAAPPPGPPSHKRRSKKKDGAASGGTSTPPSSPRTRSSDRSACAG